MAPRSWGDWQVAEREKRGWTQLDLCRESGVSERSLKRYEAGGSPRGEAVFQILSAFGFPVPDRVPLAANMEVVELRRQVEALTGLVEAMRPPLERLVRWVDQVERASFVERQGLEAGPVRRPGEAG